MAALTESCKSPPPPRCAPPAGRSCPPDLAILLHLLEPVLGLAPLAHTDVAGDQHARQPLVDRLRKHPARRAPASRVQLVLVHRLPAAPRTRRQGQPHVQVRCADVHGAKADEIPLAAAADQLVRLDLDQLPVAFAAHVFAQHAL
eukprot:7386735-Prymnesium_polylepis.1